MEPDKGVNFYWETLIFPTHGEISFAPDGESIIVSYIPQTDFTGTDFFTMQVTDSKGGQAEIYLIISVDQQYLPLRSHIDSLQTNTFDQTDPGSGREVRTDPIMEILPVSDQIWIYYCEPNTVVTLTIDTINQWTNQSNNEGRVSFYTYPFDILPGQTVTMSDGTNETTHSVTNLTITDVNPETDIVTGTADPESEITVDAFTGSEYQSLTVTANSSGDWATNFSGLLDLQEGESYGYAQQFDESGNRTEIYFDIDKPVLIVYPQQDLVWAHSWKLNTPVTLSINGNEWIQSSNDFGDAYFSIDFDILPGQTLTMTDGTNNGSHTVKDISISEINPDTDIVTGLADPLSELFVRVDTSDDSGDVIATANESGVWQADFSGYVDIVSGTSCLIYQQDEEYNQTRVTAYLRTPVITTYPLRDYLIGQDWTPNSTVTLTIGTNQWTEQSGNTGFVDFDISPFDLQAGQNIHLTDGEYEIDYTIENLEVTDVNGDTDTVSGTADPSTTVDVGIYIYDPITESYSYVEITVLSDEFGDWEATFTETDITTESDGNASIKDENDNKTTVNWYIPDPVLLAEPETNLVRGYQWPQVTEISLNIESNEWVLETDAYGTVIFELSPFDILPDQTVIMSGGGYEISYTVMDLSITNVDQAADIITGTAEAGSTLLVHLTTVVSSSASTSQNIQRDTVSNYLVVETAASGIWEADFSGIADIGTYYAVSVSSQEEEGGVTYISLNRLTGYETYIPLLTQ